MIMLRKLGNYLRVKVKYVFSSYMCLPVFQLMLDMNIYHPAQLFFLLCAEQLCIQLKWMSDFSDWATKMRGIWQKYVPLVFWAI